MVKELQELKKAFNPTFFIAFAVLLFALLGLRFITSALEWVLRKEEVPLRRELNTIPGEIGPYRLIRSETLPESVERQLGTDQYISFIYHDTRLEPGEPGSGINLHVVYYTGNQEPVSAAHVPEICYAGSGYTRVDVRQIDLDVPFDGGRDLPDGGFEIAAFDGARVRLPGRVIPMREFEFLAPGSNELGTVLYFFFYNGRYVSSRREITLHFLDRSSRKVYYCKVEVAPGTLIYDSLGLSRGLSFSPGTGSAENTREKTAEFMSWILPEIKACLPDDAHFLEVDSD